MPPHPPALVAFGSCAKESRPQPIWDAVVAAGPELFIFLGDNIYGDSDDMGVLREKYAQLGAQPGFRKLRETCPVLATWDDHDYGRNDAGVEFAPKRESQRVFLEFFEEPAGSPRWGRDGIYHSQRFPGADGRVLQVILLDTRFFRGPLFRVAAEMKAQNRGPYAANPDPDVTVLGEAQWKWFEEELKKPADLRLVATSIQAIPVEHGWEKWGNFPVERSRLFTLLRSTGANGVVLLSGDRHLGEISMVGRTEPGGPGYPVFEVTSSGLTQAGGGTDDEPNRFRVGADTPFRLANFGAIAVDWAAHDPPVHLQIRDGMGTPVVELTVPLSHLNEGGHQAGRD